jgi:fucose 4-O-acetylase-like acetyltransferase
MTRGTGTNQLDLTATSIGTRSGWIDNVRGLAILLVVVGHVIQFGSHGQFDHFENPLFVAIYAFHMPLFASISGFLAFNAFQKRTNRTIMLEKVRSLLVPLIAWTAIFGTMVLYLTRTVRSAGGALEAVRDQLIFPASTLWFLLFLFLAFGISAITLYAERFIGMAALPLSIALVFLIPLDHALSLNQLRWLYPFFLAGLLTRRYREHLRRFERLVVVVSAVAFFGLLGFWQREFSVYLSDGRLVGETPFESILIWTYRFALGTSGVITVTGLVRLISKQRSMRLLQSLGRASLGIYCLQTYAMLALGRLPAPSEMSGYFLVYVPLVSLVVLLVSYFLTLFVLERFRVLRVVLLGGR